MQDVIKLAYGNYSQEDLKILYNENVIKDSLLYKTFQLKSRIIKSLDILIDNGEGKSVIYRLSNNDVVQVICYYDSQLYMAIGKVGTIHTPDTLTLDCSSQYDNSVKNIDVGNIRYIKLLDDKSPEYSKGGLFIKIATLKSIVDNKDIPSDIPDYKKLWEEAEKHIQSSNSNYQNSLLTLNEKEQELFKQHHAMNKWFEAQLESIHKDRIENEKIANNDTKLNDKTIPFDSGSLYKFDTQYPWSNAPKEVIDMGDSFIYAINYIKQHPELLENDNKSTKVEDSDKIIDDKNKSNTENSKPTVEI